MATVGRLFVGVGLDDEARHRLAHDLGDPTRLPGRLVKPDNWHVTLRFLGDVDDVGFDRLLSGLDEAAFGGPFTMTWGPLGAFPKPSKATVLWVGVDRGAGELQALEREVGEVTEGAGFAPEERPFRPHLTLSRIRPPVDVSELVERTPDPCGSMSVNDLVVYRSHPGAGGASYEVMERFGL